MPCDLAQDTASAGTTCCVNRQQHVENVGAFCV